ncbi:hypothetical protein AcW2_000533 [Taiwanofungus camphoratus]|nr:hypothetical protein AcW2_000533 [Antrodia cinnamomea]
MYATPATGSNQNANDLEDYLLGKKRVDKILTADENEKIGAAHKNFIATQYANTARDVAAKIREDPLLAIKQQEQAAYQALMSNPLRLREMQERTGIKPKKEKKEKKEKKKDKHKKDSRHDRSISPYDERRRLSSRERYSRSRRSPSPHERRSRSPPPRSRHSGEHVRSRDDDYYGRARGRSRSHTPDSYHHKDRSVDRRGEARRESERVHTWPRSDESDDNGYESRRSGHYTGRDAPDDRKRRRSRSRSPGRYDDLPPKRSRMSPPPLSRPPPSSSRPPVNSAEDRAARLAAMSSDASSLTVERRERLTVLLAQEKAELEAEERARAKSKGMGGFLNHEQKKVFGGEGGLEDRIRRGRGQMRVEAD